jgi:hypothetical protein
LKTLSRMRAIAKGLVLGKAAPAERNHSSSRQAELIPLRVMDREFSFQTERPIVSYRYF